MVVEIQVAQSFEMGKYEMSKKHHNGMMRIKHCQQKLLDEDD